MQQTFIDTYKTFIDNTDGTYVTMAHNKGFMVLRASLDKEYLIKMSTIQAAIMLMFNESDEISGFDIQIKLNIPENELLKACTGLMYYKLLVGNKAKMELKLNETPNYGKCKLEFKEIVKRNKQRVKTVDKKRSELYIE